MSGTDAAALPSGGVRVLMTSTVVSAAAGAVVLVLGTHDARLLRLGLVAALWAALLGAFAVARMRRESSSCADRVDQLRAVYQLELEREVTARREYTQTVERELREQAELSQRREIGVLHAELAAMRVNMEQLLGGNPLLERVTLRAESTRLPPLPTHPRTVDDSHSRSTVAAAVKAPPSLTGPELRFGPSRLTSIWNGATSPADTRISNGGTSNGQGRHGVPAQESNSNGTGSHNNGSHHNGSHHNGSHHNGSHHNGGGTLHSSGQTPSTLPAAQAQRTVQDLLAAHGVASAPRRRRNHQDGPATSG